MLRPPVCFSLLTALLMLPACTGTLQAEEPAPPAEKITATVTDWAGVEQVIRQYRGKPVIVDLWSTSCEPCLRELPGLARLQQMLGDRVVCVTVSLDYFGGGKGPSAELQQEVLKVLRQQKLQSINLISSTPDETIYTRLDLGSVPAVLVYSREGKLVHRFDNEEDKYGEKGFTYDGHILPYVRDLLSGG
ncbi:MAG: TlpA family protein disulfide reductase [Planctomycetaceae bacterium]|nr:TlpA family protein disulfide reductase [Planctomycetaceae bacterium]